MERSRKFLSVVCFIGLLCFIFSILILAPKITFAEVSEKVKSEVSEKVKSEVSEKVVAAEKININTATQEELAQLKGIGPNLAQRVVEYRDQHGPFGKIKDILKVKGLGEKFLEENHDRLTIGEEVKEEAKKIRK